MELTDLVENAVIADLNLDPAIAVWNPEQHDGVNAKGGEADPGDNDDQILIIVVTADDRGDWPGAAGAGIKSIGVTIELDQNVGINPDTDSILSVVAEKIHDRLPATHLVDFSRHQAFCSSRLKVFRIESSRLETTLDVDLLRQRVIEREFICAQVG